MIYNYLNKSARGIKGTELNAEFDQSKKVSIEELTRKKEAANLLVRRSGQGFKRRARNAEILEEGTQVDFIVLEGEAYYVGDIKQDNSLMSTVPDCPMVNINTSIVVSINGKRQVVEAQIDRLTIGDRDTYNKVNFDQSKKMIGKDGKKYQLNNQKSLSLLVTLPESNLEKEAYQKINELYEGFQLLHDYLMTQVEKSAIGEGNKFKSQSMFITTKDVLRGLIQGMVPDATDDEVKQIVGSCFAANGVGPLSTMSIDLMFTVTKVIRSDDHTLYPEYEEVDEGANALRTFVTAYNVSVPINPQILVAVSGEMERFKRFLISQLISIHNLAFDEDAGVISRPCPQLEINKHTLASIEKEEYSQFQMDELPKVARKGVDEFFSQMDIRSKKKYAELKEEELDDDFNRED